MQKYSMKYFHLLQHKQHEVTIIKWGNHLVPSFYFYKVTLNFSPAFRPLLAIPSPCPGQSFVAKNKSLTGLGLDLIWSKYM